MLSPIEKLNKILDLEEKMGYANRAVIGGLERLAQFWGPEATEAGEALPVEEIVTLLRRYPEEEEERRKALIEEIRSLMKGRERVPVAEKRGPAKPKERVDIDSPVTELHGVSKAYAQRLRRLGVETIRDLLYPFPHRYDDFRALKTIDQLEYGEEVTIVGTIWETQNRETRRGKTITTSIISDSTSTIQAIWFNQPYLLKTLKPGRKIVLSGKVDQYLGRLTLPSPAWEPLDQELIHTGRLVPVYPLTKGIGARWMRRLMKRTVDYWSLRLPDHLPAPIREQARLLDLETAIQQIHFPDDWEMVKAARHRLAFDEFLLIQLGVLKQRRIWREEPGRPLPTDEALLDRFTKSLPFNLTKAQERVLSEILADLQESKPMSRLLQGDVGSGKTVVAAAAMLMAVANGAQGVIMAPTEILAEQHYTTLHNLYKTLKVNLRLLTGSLKAEEREEAYREIASGRAQVVVGTHALIQEGVEFHDLALAVIDEQHRFGVRQRSALRQKGHNPHVLVMTATPIPRTLALTLYGDLDISIIDELPPGRKKITTKWMAPRERERAYAFIRSQVEEGNQAFIICPLVEESEKINAKAAVEEHERLQSIFPDLRLGLIHGRMSAPEKEAVMRDFYQGNLDILVATPVVEVGIDVPRATVLLVEGADRFGLAQLHQFRGRVGRGEAPSYCLLLAESPSSQAEERLKAIESSQDGFYLAEVDLEMRGPGEFFGTRQSGLPDLKVARLSDVKVLEEARALAKEIFQEDPDLELPQHRLLARRVADFWRGEGDLS
ncbi:MAG: ATP-dependent DNA helicase RecG [Anaerolineae bacterium]